MNKREFLKLSSDLVSSALLMPLLGACARKEPFTSAATAGIKTRNWAGNLAYGTTNIYEPTTVDEVRRLVGSHSKLRALGTRHCFNTIADSDQNLLSTRLLNQVEAIDSANKSITVGAGVRYGDFCKALYEQGYALHNLASLPHISVAGACATATHGSGVKNGGLATSVKAVEFVSGAGELITLSRGRDGDVFNGAVVHLGSLGVLTRITLDLVPAFDVTQLVYLDLPFDQMQKHFAEIMSAGYSVSLFYDWQTDRINQVWVKDVAQSRGSAKPVEFFGATPANRNVHPILALSAENCTEQMGVPGPWYDRLPHFKLGFTPSSGKELQAEYFVPLDNAVEAIKAVRTLREELKGLLMITEIRTVAADEFWMSMSYRRPSVAIHFTLQQNIAGVEQFLHGLEQKLGPFQARPHWGKLFSTQPDLLQSRYERVDDFRKLTEKYDPEHKFQNEFIRQKLFG